MTIQNILINKGKVFIDDFGFKRMIDEAYFSGNVSEIEYTIYDAPET
jgi:hypothetical protein